MSSTGRAVAYLVALLVAVGGINLLWTAHEVNANNAARAQQGEVAERKLCTTLSALAALQPPPGTAADNPSRAYLQELHRTLAQLGPDIGCKEKTR